MRRPRWRCGSPSTLDNRRTGTDTVNILVPKALDAWEWISLVWGETIRLFRGRVARHRKTNYPSKTLTKPKSTGNAGKIRRFFTSFLFFCCCFFQAGDFGKLSAPSFRIFLVSSRAPETNTWPISSHCSFCFRFVFVFLDPQTWKPTCSFYFLKNRPWNHAQIVDLAIPHKSG